MQNKCLGVFLVVVAFPLVIFSILLFSARGFLGANFYSKLLKNSNSYSKTVSLFNEQKSAEAGDILTLVAQNATPTWLQQNVEKNLTDFFLFANGKKASPELGVDLKSINIKEELKKNSDIPAEAIAKFPDQLTIDSYVKYLEEMQKTMLSGPTSEQAISKEDLATISEQIAEAKNLQKKLNQNLSSIKMCFLYFKIGSYIIFGLTLLILILIGVAARHYSPAIFRWIGEALIIPAGFLSLIIIILQKLSASYNPLSTIEMSAEVKQLVFPLYINSANTLSANILSTALVVSLLGLLLVIISYIIPKFIARHLNTSA